MVAFQETIASHPYKGWGSLYSSFVAPFHPVSKESGKMLISLLALGALALGVPALMPKETFYPPTLNDTSYITNSSLGLYGGIYSAPADEATAGSPYGVYDYCSMPHPCVDEYQLPQPLQSGQVKGKLVYLEYLQRHQRRTAYNILPGGEVRGTTSLAP